MAKGRISAGVLLHRRRDRELQVFLVHPGGPFWAKKDAGVWSIPKGELCEGEDALACARREFEEETGVAVGGTFRELAPVRQANGKLVHAWTLEGELDPAQLKSNTFTVEWPPRSGRMQEFPEVDRGEWFTLAQARAKINPAQADFLAQLESMFPPPRAGGGPDTVS